MVMLLSQRWMIPTAIRIGKFYIVYHSFPGNVHSVFVKSVDHPVGAAELSGGSAPRFALPAGNSPALLDKSGKFPYNVARKTAMREKTRGGPAPREPAAGGSRRRPRVILAPEPSA